MFLRLIVRPAWLKAVVYGYVPVEDHKTKHFLPDLTNAWESDPEGENRVSQLSLRKCIAYAKWRPTTMER